MRFICGAGTHAQLFALNLLGKLPEASQQQQDTLMPLVRALDAAFPEEMDAAVNHLLQRSKGTDQAAGQQVVQLLQQALAGSAQAPLAAAGSTLSLALDAPAAETRILVSTCSLSDQDCTVSEPCQGLTLVGLANGAVSICAAVVLMGE